MASSLELKDPWLVAIWPGMGSVAMTAGTYLTASLGPRPLGQLPSSDFFDIDKVEIRDGVARIGSRPSCNLYAWKAPQGGRDLIFFVGEAQPSHRSFEFCNRLLSRTREFGVKRVVTFAAMGTQIPPSAQPRVFAAVNHPQLLVALREVDVHPLSDGQISGLNGLLLAAAADFGLKGICLLGEMPYFAMGVPNPKSSLRVLEVFMALANVRVDLGKLQKHAREVEPSLIELMERMHRALSQRDKSEPDEEEAFPDTFEVADEAPETPGKLSSEDRKHIEELFRRTEQERSQALKLKHELDRLGIFKEYEDRFLDLFKRGE